MKKFFSLSELGSCCRPQAAPALAAAARDETGSCASGGHAPPRLRRASRRSWSPAAAQWRPGLPAISEDGAVISAAARKANPTARSKVVGSTANNKSRIYRSGGGGSTRDDPRTNTMPVIIPAFSPTPFVF